MRSTRWPFKIVFREEGGGRGKGGEMTPTLYAHINKRKKIVFRTFAYAETVYGQKAMKISKLSKGLLTADLTLERGSKFPSQSSEFKYKE
jgi:hypothetical protein